MRFLTTALAVAAVGVASVARADSTPSLALTPAPAGDRAFVVERGGVHGHWLWSARLFTEYAHEPLVLRNRIEEIHRAVSHQTWLYGLVSLSLWHRLLLHASVPVVVAQGGDPAPLSGATAPAPASGIELGDVRLGARFRFFRSSDDPTTRVELAAASSAWLPTAGAGYGGDGALRAGAGITANGTSQRLYWALNGGVRTRPSQYLAGVLPSRSGTAVAFGMAAGFFADGAQRIALGTELVSDLTVGAGARLFDPRASVAHLFITAHCRLRGGPLELGAAVGPGLGQGAGAADFRGLLVLGFAPEEVAPRFDTDGDGVPDISDACIDLAGIPSGDPLLNGCPAAPIDRDGDAIPDENDACPTVAGEPTGVRATHGCPPPVEGDSRKAEAPTTKLVAEQIVLSQQVQFETGTAVLRSQSSAVLSEVARVLGEHPEVEQVEVQGHTDEQGTAEYNRRLGEARAEAVVSWLTAHGVKKGRLTSKGYGSDRPIADNTTEEGRQKNRRVEFRVTRTKTPANSDDRNEGGTK